MQDIQKSVLIRAIAMLKSTGSQFAVIDADGVKHGELEVVHPKTRKTRVVSGINYKDMYLTQVQAIQPGEEINIFVPPPGISPESYRGALCSWCSVNWGKDTYSTNIRDGVIHLMRWA